MRIATAEAVSVGLKTQVGRMTQDPATAAVLCDNVKGLCISLDPSHYVYGPLSGVDYDGLMKYVCHVQLRDTTKNKLQVRVGQGAVEYGRLISQLSRFRYNRALCVNVIEADNEAEGVDHMAEMRENAAAAGKPDLTWLLAGPGARSARHGQAFRRHGASTNSVPARVVSCRASLAASLWVARHGELTGRVNLNSTAISYYSRHPGSIEIES